MFNMRLADAVINVLFVVVGAAADDVAILTMLMMVSVAVAHGVRSVKDKYQMV